MANPLIDDRDIEFLLHEVHDALALTSIPRFEAYDKETIDLTLRSARSLAREHLWPAYRPMDEAPPALVGGRVRAHPLMAELWPRMAELGLVAATRGDDVGGSCLPLMLSTAADAYLMAGNLSAFGYVGLTRGAAHLVEVFGDDSLRERFMTPMYAGEWTGTMALTEPQAGSSLAEITTKATPTPQGHYKISGSKIFISAADHGLTPNVVNMVLARIEGAPEGTAGISLFAVPARREQGESWVDNDVNVAGAIHKIGWRGLPSLALNFGERDDCHGWLVGPEHRGLSCMFQMMNEARIMIGLNAVATASVAYHESLAYARERPQGRVAGVKGAGAPVPIIEHADVRRMLLRQKAIVEGGLSLVMQTARYADLAEHHPDDAVRSRSAALLDLLTPMTKSFPAERGFDSNALALQIHGGYGYTSEYLPEAWLRDQKLNSIHEGTTGIQALDLLGRKTLKDGGRAFALLRGEVSTAMTDAKDANVSSRMIGSLQAGLDDAIRAATVLGGQATTDVPGALAHASDFLDLMSTVVVGWQWLLQASAAQRGLARGDADAPFYRAKLAAAEHFMQSEVPRTRTLVHRCEHDRSFATVDPRDL